MLKGSNKVRHESVPPLASRQASPQRRGREKTLKINLSHSRCISVPVIVPDRLLVYNDGKKK